MLKYIRWRENCFKFNSGINYFDDYDVVDAAGSIFGGFTGAFTKGNGRRIELKDDDVEISMSGSAKFNEKVFNFTRVYTKLRAETDEMDKRQDITRYGKKLNDAITGTKEEEKNFCLPLISYYGTEIKYEPVFTIRMDEKDVINERTNGYASCLIVYTKFELIQKYFVIGSYLAWQQELSNKNNSFSVNYKKSIKQINELISKFGYSNISYSFELNDICVEKEGNKIAIKNIEDDKEKLMVAVVVDVYMRALMLNSNYMENTFDTEGCIVFSYEFGKDMMKKIVNNIRQSFPNVQLIIYEK